MSDPVLGYWCSELDGQPSRIEAIIRMTEQPYERWEKVDERVVLASATGKIERRPLPPDVEESITTAHLLGLSPVDVGEIQATECRVAATIDAVAEADDSAPAIPLRAAVAVNLVPTATVWLAREFAQWHEWPEKNPDKVAMVVLGAIFVDVIGCAPALVQMLCDEALKRADQSPKIWERGWNRLRVTVRALGAAA